MIGKMFGLYDNQTWSGYGHNVYVYRNRQDGHWMYKVRLQYIIDNMVVDSVLMSSIDASALQCMVKDMLKRLVAGCEKQDTIAQYVNEQLWKWDWTE